MIENQTPETNETQLEDCLFHLTVKDGLVSIKAEGTIGNIAEAFANAALQSPQLDEVLKVSTYMLFQHHMSNQEESHDEDELSGEASKVMQSLFGNNIGQA